MDGETTKGTSIQKPREKISTSRSCGRVVRLRTQGKNEREERELALWFICTR